MSDRPFKFTVSVLSETTGADGKREVQQNVIVEEYSDTDEEHVLKNFHVANAVTTATYQAMKELAEAAGYVTELPKGKPKK